MGRAEGPTTSQPHEWLYLTLLPDLMLHGKTTFPKASRQPICPRTRRNPLATPVLREEELPPAYSLALLLQPFVHMPSPRLRVGGTGFEQYL